MIIKQHTAAGFMNDFGIGPKVTRHDCCAFAETFQHHKRKHFVAARRCDCRDRVAVVAAQILFGKAAQKTHVGATAGQCSQVLAIVAVTGDQEVGGNGFIKGGDHVLQTFDHL